MLQERQSHPMSLYASDNVIPMCVEDIVPRTVLRRNSKGGRHSYWLLSSWATYRKESRRPSMSGYVHILRRTLAAQRRETSLKYCYRVVNGQRRKHPCRHYVKDTSAAGRAREEWIF